MITMMLCANENVYEFRGLSTDDKPLDKVGNGSTFFEIDTSKCFMFDETNKRWEELE